MRKESKTKSIVAPYAKSIKKNGKIIVVNSFLRRGGDFYRRKKRYKLDIRVQFKEDFAPYPHSIMTRMSKILVLQRTDGHDYLMFLSDQNDVVF